MRRGSLSKGWMRKPWTLFWTTRTPARLSSPNRMSSVSWKLLTSSRCVNKQASCSPLERRKQHFSGDLPCLAPRTVPGTHIHTQLGLCSLEMSRGMVSWVTDSLMRWSQGSLVLRTYTWFLTPGAMTMIYRSIIRVRGIWGSCTHQFTCVPSTP